ncbi:hypothetical protein PAPYR_8625 [Paratrimastix pyriformis]|uniref:Uncharacterized protein n=1 Tax=Paratrimastix pyriformis TaxID=342808 RepID=A0ABQ8UAB8_9EUKA|nr:hypothetical protein PAPYR_8625 [Paratrimastix pyriformis]
MAGQKGFRGGALPTVCKAPRSISNYLHVSFDSRIDRTPNILLENQMRMSQDRQLSLMQAKLESRIDNVARQVGSQLQEAPPTTTTPPVSAARTRSSEEEPLSTQMPHHNHHNRPRALSAPRSDTVQASSQAAGAVVAPATLPHHPVLAAEPDERAEATQGTNTSPSEGRAAQLAAYAERRLAEADAEERAMMEQRARDQEAELQRAAREEAAREV